MKSGRLPKGVQEYHCPEVALHEGIRPCGSTPIIIGLGPAGLFAALGLVRKGIRPLILEQGRPVEDRVHDVAALEAGKGVNPKSNVVFGEGGAGTFSDGKLTARNRSAASEYVYRTLVEFGADPRIVYQARPHLGTDKLRKMIPAMRAYLISQGAEIRFQEEAVAWIRERGGVTVKTASGGAFHSQTVILAGGHSAFEVYNTLSQSRVPLEKKPFAVGLRIEHPREFIDVSQYGRENDFKVTGAADYSLSAKGQNGRGVYSFCVCPGGSILHAGSDNGHLAVNGMSGSGRNGPFTNGALVVSVYPEDLPEGPLAGLLFRRRIEAAAQGQTDCKAPAQRAGDYLRGGLSKRVEASFRPGVRSEDLNGLFPKFINETLKIGLVNFERKIRDFIDKGVLVGPETGTSSPVRIIRSPETFESTGMPGLYPVGEGAGYSGGIISSAVDGLSLALKFKSV